MTLLQRSTERLDIDLLVLPETNLILIASVIEPLRGANRIAGSELYRWRLLTPDGAPVPTTSAIAIPAEGTFRATTEETPLFVLASYNWRRSATPALKMQLSQAARHRTIIAGIESGTWLLAEASLLDGLPATVHWEDYEDFALAYPEVRAVKDRFVIDGKRLTTSGSLPTVDLMLEVIRQRQGYSLALEVSRLFRYEQPSFHVDEPLSAGLRMHDPRVTQAVRLMEEHIEQPLILTRLARRIGISARHLQDLFQQSIGAPPHVHYLALRLNAARRKVIETTASFADIAAATGFNSASAFARSYRASFSESASETRRRLRRRITPSPAPP
ncbi:GlxA family transcriptional regulator (plasmid) [Rhizobium acidisoli]|uniref:GlxA family transcriptional regulator n=1 Tax=Rhizobium acidisoli TaxID=1538158 RepID=A0AAE5WUV8_9HYPH|nr:GlxA family transcriptional regulator [Rhizobium acidisoli]KPH07522.1 AraC family transcriptional regulator [Rhizobium acidisoli]QAS82849.1 GlxA family transcriptional regulator [Rhizobium acidisoli]